YGMMQGLFLWFGGIGGMLFMGLFMMPFYYRNRFPSVPAFFRARYNESTRAFNAVTYALFVILNAGINMYAMALVFNLLLGWSFTEAILLAGAIVIVYTTLGGLSSSIYNEALQFFLLTLGLVPLLIFGLIHVGGWGGLQEKLHRPDSFFHLWKYTGSTDNPYGVQWFVIGLGIGFAISFSYYCTDFLVVQRALAAENEARSLYLEAAKYCDSINDRVSKRLFEDLAEDEEGHIDFLETQLELIKQVGLPLYAQKHIGGLEQIAPEKE
ncbi:MAG: hypothetical protein INR70_03350, partial [Parafilimonas terrae]|nr:hypothetical protein [Parafilimonas terrae]